MFEFLVKDMESNADWNICIDHNGMTMGRCVHACDGNEACELDCLNAFKIRQMNCPCEVSIISVPRLNMTSAAPLSVVLSLLSQWKEG